MFDPPVSPQLLAVFPVLFVYPGNRAQAPAGELWVLFGLQLLGSSGE